MYLRLHLSITAEVAEKRRDYAKSYFQITIASETAKNLTSESLTTAAGDLFRLIDRTKRAFTLTVTVFQFNDMDVILMDLTLPRMDGFAAAKLIRQKRELQNVPIIAITAHQETGFRSDAKASGFNAYVTKPIDISWLKELINGLI